MIDFKRFQRQIILPEIGIQGQEKLQIAKVLVIGAGGLGCPILQYLCTAGIGTLGVIDDDIITESNLHRQVLFNKNEINKLKVNVIKDKLLMLSDTVCVNIYSEKLSEKNAKNIFENYDIIVDGSDNFETKYLADRFSVITKKPLVFGSIFKYEAQISVFNYKNSDSYKDVFPEKPEDSQNCSTIGVINTVAGIAGLIMANETIKIILDIGNILYNKLFIINVLTFDIKIINLKKNINKKIINTIENKIILDKEIDDICFKIDVRENYEYEEKNKGGINIPLSEIFLKINELPKNKKIIFYCNTNRRSKIAVNFLKSKGFNNAFIGEKIE